MNFTPEQEQAITLRNKNLLVSAAAGSGKTAVLVERILSKITDPEHPVDIDQLLVVTFANAAAAEMRERIAAALEKRIAKTAYARLHRQQTLLLNAQITTIHSFCIYVIRQFFYRIDLEPDFRVGEEGELRLLRQEVLEEVLERNYEQGTGIFHQLAEALAPGKNDRPLEEFILSLYEFSMSNPWPREWLEGCLLPYEIKSLAEWEDFPMGRAFRDYYKALTGEWVNLIKVCLDLCQERDGPEKYAPLLEQELEMLKDVAKCENYLDFYQAVNTLSFARLPTIRKTMPVDPLKKQMVQDTRNKVKDSRKKLLEQFFFQEPNEMLSDLNKNRDRIEMLVALTLEFWGAFSEKKREKNLLDFSDLEHFALKILLDENKEPTSAAMELQKAFEEIMIDEYQDSNYVQEAILTAVSGHGCGKKNLFMVGDVKQSIYRFRMARPELFMEKYEYYTDRPSRSQKICLHKNFRSRPQILETVNDVFRCIMAKDLGNVEYDQAAALYPGRLEESHAAGELGGGDFQTEVLVIDEEMFSEGQENAEFNLIATKILQLLKNQQVTDKESGNLRLIDHGDIVILMRSGTKASDLIQTLGDYGIPAIATTASGYFSAIEVQTVLNLLRLIDNPRQDIPMAAVLASPIGNMGGEEMALIRIQFRDLPFYRAVFRYAEEGENGFLRKKVGAFLKQLKGYRERVSHTPIHDLLVLILSESGYMDYVLALSGGQQRRTNLEMLLEKAIDYEGTSYRGLFHFIRYINQLEKYQVDYGEAEEESSNCVRIMTIHKSKGLEFPVVFLAGMGKAFNRRDENSRLVLHPELGIGLDLVDLELRTRKPSLARQTLVRQIQMENMGEELRVLYVALTRAREKLIVTGTLKKAGEKLQEYENRLFEESGQMNFLSRLSASNYFDWLLPPLMRHNYRIQQISPEYLASEQLSEGIEQEIGKQQLLNYLEQVDPKWQEAIEERLSYSYPYAREAELKTKLSVSELKHRAVDLLVNEEGEGEAVFAEEIPVPYVPAFMHGIQEENVWALRGTALHRVLECFDFTADFSTLPMQLEQMQGDGRLDERLYELISLPRLETFLESALAKRMQQAARLGKLQREKPFVMGKPAKEVIEGSQSEAMVLIQGIADAFFEEDGDLVLVDYKTDYIRNKKELLSRYHAQMDLYQEALERSTGKRVKEKIIYSFGIQEEIYV